MIKKTYSELSELDMMIGGLYRKFPELKESKFGYAYGKFYKKNLKDIVTDYLNDLADVRIDNALVDEKTKALLIIPTGRGFEYSKEGFKAVLKAENDLEKQWHLKEFEIEPYFIKPENLPELNDEQLELMKGILVE